MGIKEELEAIIFIGGDGVKIKDLAKAFSMNVIEMVNILNEIKEDKKNTGLNLEFVDEMAYFITNPRCGAAITNFYEHDTKPRKISDAALETVSIIAYKQPVTKSIIEQIRGVSCDRLIQTLEERKFIRVCGRKDGPGRPNLYEVTSNFLAYLNIDKVEDLPNYEMMRGSDGENKNK
ncbi:MAG: SMC-Scp complex subunit ScpB [Fusobacteriaceae bacterium]